MCEDVSATHLVLHIPPDILSTEPHCIPGTIKPKLEVRNYGFFLDEKKLRILYGTKLKRLSFAGQPSTS